jgi:hypothetical protein
VIELLVFVFLVLYLWVTFKIASLVLVLTIIFYDDHWLPFSIMLMVCAVLAYKAINFNYIEAAKQSVIMLKIEDLK